MLLGKNHIKHFLDKITDKVEPKTYSSSSENQLKMNFATLFKKKDIFNDIFHFFEAQDRLLLTATKHMRGHYMHIKDFDDKAAAKLADVVSYLLRLKEHVSKIRRCSETIVSYYDGKNLDQISMYPPQKKEAGALKDLVIGLSDVHSMIERDEDYFEKIRGSFEKHIDLLRGELGEFEDAVNHLESVIHDLDRY